MSEKEKIKTFLNFLNLVKKARLEKQIIKKIKEVGINGKDS